MSQAENGPIEMALRLRMPDQSIIEEPEFGAHKAAVAASLASPNGPYGGLSLRGGGQPAIVLSDDLLPLARALAAGVARLRDGQPAVIASLGEPSQWAMERDGPRIVTQSTQPGEPPEPDPEPDLDDDEDATGIDTSGAELGAAAYAPHDQRRQDDAASLIAALQDASTRLLDLLEGGGLRDAATSRKLAGARDILLGRQALPDDTGPRRGARVG